MDVLEATECPKTAAVVAIEGWFVFTPGPSQLAPARYPGVSERVLADDVAGPQVGDLVGGEPELVAEKLSVVLPE